VSFLESVGHKSRWQRAGERCKALDVIRRIGIAAAAAVSTYVLTLLSGAPDLTKLIFPIISILVAVPIWHLIEQAYWYLRLPRIEAEQELEDLKARAAIGQNEKH
jgi:hypothetical protein